MDTDVVLDGNVLAGVFGELFQHEMTIARGMCRSAGGQARSRRPVSIPRRPALSLAAPAATRCCSRS